MPGLSRVPHIRDSGPGYCAGASRSRQRSVHDQPDGPFGVYPVTPAGDLVGVKAHWLAKFEAFPDVELVVGTILAGDGEVWTRGVFRATHAGDWPPYEATGRRVEMDYMDRWIVRDGRVAGNEGFWDGVQLLPEGIRQRAGLS